MFAPDSWIKSFEAIPEAGQKCWITSLVNEDTSELFTNIDLEGIKKYLKNKCSQYETELNAFIDSVSETVKSLPENFLQPLKDVKRFSSFL